MDYKQSLLAGLQAAKAARNNKEEIFNTIGTLSQAIEEVSNGVVSITITNEQELDPKKDQVAISLSGLLGKSPYVDYQALSLVKIKDKNQKKIIARFDINNQDGYPCVISYDKQYINCKNKETLEKALMDLMATAQTGEKLLELKNNMVAS